MYCTSWVDKILKVFFFFRLFYTTGTEKHLRSCRVPCVQMKQHSSQTEGRAESYPCTGLVDETVKDVVLGGTLILGFMFCHVLLCCDRV